MKRFLTLLFSIFSLTLVIAQDGTNENANVESQLSEINWLTFEEAYELHQKEPKKWVIDVYTEWCGWCKRMDATTFKDSLIIDETNGNFYAVKIDGEYKEDIQLGEQTYQFVNEGRRGYHQLPSQLMGGKRSYPTYVFLDESLQVLTAVPGFRMAKELLPILEFVTVYNKDTNPISYQKFLEDYVSRYPAEEETTSN